MRSVLTILLLLILIGFILLYMTGRIPTLETFRGSGGGGHGRGGYGESSWWSVLSPATYLVAEEPDVALIGELPCYTDFDCPSGHCGASGMCTVKNII
jgi:hypothetical protein